MRRAACTGRERNEAGDRRGPMAVEATYVDLADNLAARTVEPQPRSTSADRRADGRCEQRLRATLPACIPKINEARRGLVLASLGGRIMQQVPHERAHVVFHSDAAFAWATHVRERRRGPRCKTSHYGLRAACPINAIASCL